MTKPRLLDLFCGGGGCSVGYHRAGFDVVGVDLYPQKHYPFEFHQADALEYLAAYGHEYDAIHASPKCQRYSMTYKLNKNPDQKGNLPEVRDALIATGKPYIIENVPGAPMINYLILCGTMFGLRVIRHRLFETSWGWVFPPASCNHDGRASGNLSDKVRKDLTNYQYLTVVGHDFILADARIAMGIDWMNQKELSQAIPPAYTEHIGLQLLRVLMGETV
jgi:DNA (cytosine-5)-methyltransferase 1